MTLHPSADLALLRVNDGAGIFTPFHSVGQIHGAGDGAVAFGYPEDSTTAGLAPVPRMFRGFVQRVFEHKSHLGYSYVADELSFPIPQGLSGGPVVFDRNPWEVVGVAAEVIEASTYVRTIAEVKESGREYYEKVRAVVQHGVAVRLEHVRAWLDDTVPPAGAA